MSSVYHASLIWHGVERHQLWVSMFALLHELLCEHLVIYGLSLDSGRSLKHNRVIWCLTESNQSSLLRWRSTIDLRSNALRNCEGKLCTCFAVLSNFRNTSDLCLERAWWLDTAFLQVWNQLARKLFQCELHLSLHQLWWLVVVVLRLTLAQNLQELDSLRLYLLAWEDQSAQYVLSSWFRVSRFSELLRWVVRPSEWSHYLWDRSSPKNTTIAEVSLYALYQTHLDLQVLDDHLHCSIVSFLKRNDDVCILHRWTDKVVVSRLDKSVVLS